jgi:23S rRNA pseudouridine1911/1915/1917 synthase
VSLTAAAEDAGERLDVVLAAHLPEYSRSAIAGLIRDGKAMVEGRAAKASQRVRAGDSVTIEVVPQARRDVVAEDIPLTIVFRDADIAVIDKPAGLVVHPAPGHWTGTLANAILGAFPMARDSGSPDRPGIVHRLDKDTSGLIAIGLSPRGMAALHKQIGSREAQRRYLALVRGTPDPAEGVIEAPIGRDPADRKRMTPFGVAARSARTRYRVLERYRGVSLVEASLETGRTHQIRVHFAATGHPVAGDEVYGGPHMPGLHRQFLHAHRLRLRLPSSREEVELESPLPADLAAVLENLRGNSETVENAGVPDAAPLQTGEPTS